MGLGIDRGTGRDRRGGDRRRGKGRRPVTGAPHLKAFRDGYGRFGGESGDPRVAENRLLARQQRRQELDIVALSPDTRARFYETVARGRTAFIDDPARCGGRCRPAGWLVDA